jgi:hypothetical protein
MYHVPEPMEPEPAPVADHVEPADEAATLIERLSRYQRLSRTPSGCLSPFYELPS